MNSLPGDPADDTPQPLSATAHPSRRVPFTRASVAAFAAVDARRRSEFLDYWSLQTKRTRPLPGDCKVTQDPPGGSRSSSEVQRERLVAVVKDARRARGNRKQLRRPRRPRRKGDTSMFRRMRGHLRETARRALNDLARARQPIPEAEPLAEALAALVWDEYRDLIQYREPGSPPLGRARFAFLDDEAVERVAASAARYVLARWSPDYIREQQVRGAKGGRRSRRGPSKATLANVARLRELEGLSAAKAAAELGVSVSTVYAMRRTLREQRPAPAPVERPPHARLTERQERAAYVRERAEEDEAYRRAAEAEARAATEREHAEHMARVAILAQRPPDPARDLDALLPA